MADTKPTQSSDVTEIIIKIMECYYHNEPAIRRYIRRMSTIWNERGGFELTKNRLG